MPHTPPLPDASIAPFPAQPAAQVDAPSPSRPDTTASDDKTRRVIAGAAVGIGSAAIVAALLYTNRKPAKDARSAAESAKKDRKRAD